MSMTVTEEKIISWLKEQKIFVWMVGTAIFTYLFVLLFYYLARGIGASIAILKAITPSTEWIDFQIDVTSLLYNAVGGIGLMLIIVIPAFSFALVRKFTNIFLIESEEKERWRQKELKRIIGDLKNARKMIWSMGFSKEPTDAMYKKTQWAEPERASVHKVIEILSGLVKKKKKEEPAKELRADEIKYLVQQKRKKASKMAKDLLEEERRRRQEELELLEELIEDTDSEVRELAQEDAILEAKLAKAGPIVVTEEIAVEVKEIVDLGGQYEKDLIEEMADSLPQQKDKAPAGVAELMELHGIPPQEPTHAAGTDGWDFGDPISDNREFELPDADAEELKIAEDETAILKARLYEMVEESEPKKLDAYADMDEWEKDEED